MITKLCMLNSGRQCQVYRKIRCMITARRGASGVAIAVIVAEKAKENINKTWIILIFSWILFCQLLMLWCIMQLSMLVQFNFSYVVISSRNEIYYLNQNRIQFPVNISIQRSLSRKNWMYYYTSLKIVIGFSVIFCYFFEIRTHQGLIFCRQNIWSSEHKKITREGGLQKSCPQAPVVEHGDTCAGADPEIFSRGGQP